MRIYKKLTLATNKEFSTNIEVLILIVTCFYDATSIEKHLQNWDILTEILLNYRLYNLQSLIFDNWLYWYLFDLLCQIDT